MGDIEKRDADNSTEEQVTDASAELDQQDTDTKDLSDEEIMAEVEELEDDSEAQAALRFAEIKERITTLATASAKQGGSPLDCALLDWAIIKPYIQPVNIVLYGGAAALLGFTMGNVFFGFLAGFLLGTLFLSYPFAVSGKYETDKLYKSLGMRPANVVMGRYLFSLGFAVAAALGALLFASLGVHFSRVAETVSFSAETAGAMLILAALFLTVIMIQLPIYFHVGFVRARYAGVLPLAAAFVLLVSLATVASGDLIIGTNRAIDFATENPWLGAASVGACIAVGIGSCLLSLATYKKQVQAISD
ncbi:MAG: ABC-2 transporter permease [Coriobacteriia bacterium]|nr:ABC-2 transporter permease [Coriobacteriia bacterium]